VAQTDRTLSPDDQVIVAVRPEKIRLLPRPLAGENNSFAGKVEQVVYIGTATVFKIRLSDQVLLTVREQNVISASEREAYDWGSGGQVYVAWLRDAGRILLG